MWNKIKEFFGFTEAITLNLNPEPGQEIKPIEYTSTYEAPQPFIFDPVSEKTEEKETV